MKSIKESQLHASSNLYDVVYSPNIKFLQFGYGGNWWTGKVLYTHTFQLYNKKLPEQPIDVKWNGHYKFEFTGESLPTHRPIKVDLSTQKIQESKLITLIDNIIKKHLQ